MMVMLLNSQRMVLLTLMVIVFESRKVQFHFGHSCCRILGRLFLPRILILFLLLFFPRSPIEYLASFDVKVDANETGPAHFVEPWLITAVESHKSRISKLNSKRLTIAM